jgi:hypothetical protein
LHPWHRREKISGTSGLTFAVATIPGYGTVAFPAIFWRKDQLTIRLGFDLTQISIHCMCQASQTAPQDAAPTATAALPDHTQLPQTMARDLANVERNIEQLKTNQQQIASDNSKAIESSRRARKR